MKTQIQKKLEIILTNAQDLSFEHGRNSVDVHIWDNDGDKILTCRGEDCDLWLKFFDYGSLISDDVELNKKYLELILC
jgi:hypothetical protein